MLKVNVVAFGKCKESWLQEALAEYEKRLIGRLEFTWIEPKTESQLERCLMQESSFIALDPKGEACTSERFSQKLSSLFETQGSRLVFSIGGPDGFSANLLRKASWRLSLSPMTFTHQLARLVLVEQIYRALEIARGSPYHK